jgi:ribose transport system substrate-binding protein
MKQPQRNLDALSVVLLVTTLVLGCSRPTGPQPTPQRTSKQYVIGVSLASLDGPWRAQMKADIEAAAAKHPDLRLIVLDAQNDAAKQRAQLDELFHQRVNLVIISPKDAQGATEAVARLFGAGIPVIVLDRALIGDKYNCYIAADPREIGTAVGQWMAKRLSGKGNLVEIRGPVDVLWAEELHDAWRAVLRDPGYRFVFDGHLDPPRVDATKLMDEALERVKQIDAVFACDDTAALAAHRAAKAAGRQKGVLWVSVGGTPTDGAAAVKDGILAATFLHPTGGAEAIDIALKLLHGEKTPKKIVLPTRAITTEIPR